jgi:hypothetical protein
VSFCQIFVTKPAPKQFFEAQFTGHCCRRFWPVSGLPVASGSGVRTRLRCQIGLFVTGRTRNRTVKAESVRVICSDSSPTRSPYFPQCPRSGQDFFSQDQASSTPRLPSPSPLARFSAVLRNPPLSRDFLFSKSSLVS